MAPRSTAVLAALALTASLTATLAPAGAADSPSARGGTVVTDYGFSGRAYGSLAKASPLAVGSAPSAPSYLACTRRAGKYRDNYVAAAGDDSRSVLRVSRADNTTKSFRTRSRVGTKSVSKVAKAVLGDPDGIHLTIEGIRTIGTAYAHRGNGRLAATADATANRIQSNTGTPLDLVLNDADAGLDTLLDAITDAGGQLVIPGLGELRSGENVARVRKNMAIARVAAIKARLYGEDGMPDGGDDVRAVLARSRAVIYEDVRSGVFSGRAVPLESQLLGGAVNVGRVVDKPMPCPGTRGKVKELFMGSPDLGDADLVRVSALRGRVFGEQRAESARGWTESTVASVNLGDGEVRLSGITGRVNVTTDRKGDIVRRDFRGSTIGRLVIGGERRPAPRPGDVVKVPGLATLRFFLRDKRARGASVTAVRITLLPGTPEKSVIDLGHARAFIARN